MILIGIDPGLSGALARLEDGKLTLLEDLPTIRLASGRRVYNVQALALLLHRVTRGGQPLWVLLERQHPMPKQGVTSTFSIGYGAGLLEGILATLGVPYELVPAKSWRRVMLAGMPAGKASSLIVAARLYPQAEIGRHHGRADALLIAEYGRRQHA
jgi:hypothetical protein